jgi:hypothetical protein
MQVPRIWRGGRGWRKLALAIVGVAGVAAGAFFLGRGSSTPRAEAKPPAPAAAAGAEVPPPAPPEPSSDYTRRVVAYIYGSVPITREDLGEYLIARQGALKLDLLVNKRIIEHACQQRGIQVVEAEIDAALAEDIKELKLRPVDFEKFLLQRYSKSLYEWREDVVRPKLLMQKMCRDRIVVLPEDLLKAYEAYHGEKVQLRVIMWPRAEKDKVMNEIYPRIRDSEKEFNEVAKHQASPSLAAAGGKIEPMGRYTAGDEVIEKEAFSLRQGEISRVIETKEHVVVLKCDGRMPPDATVSLEQVRDKLEKEILRKKIEQEVPILFAELREKAAPKTFLPKPYLDAGEQKRDVEQELQQVPGSSRLGQPPPGGN